MNTELIWIALQTASMSFAYALMVYLSKTDEEKWDFIKAGKTALMGAIVAFVGVYYGVSEGSFISSPMYSFIGLLVEKLLKVVQRKVIPKFLRWLDEEE